MNKKILMLLIFFILLMSVVAVSAADSDDNNDIVVLSDDAEILSAAKDVDSIGNLNEDDANSSDKALQNDAKLAATDENDLLTDNAPGTFTDLKNLLSGKKSVTLTKNYTWVESDGILDRGINIGSITIDGAGHTINGNDRARMFNGEGKIYLRNINFINSHNDEYYDGHSVICMSADSDNILEVTNCNFTDNDDSYGAVAIWISKGKLTVKNCRFESNIAAVETCIGADKGVKSDISNCIFINNRCFSIYAYDDALIHDCTFINNGAVDGWNNKVYNNNFTNCYHVIAMHSGEIYNNTFINNTGDIIRNREGVTVYGAKLEVRNNTFINNDGNIIISQYSPNSKFTNNKYMNNTLYGNTDACFFVDETFINNKLILDLEGKSEISHSKFFNNTEYRTASTGLITTGKSAEITDNEFINNSACCIYAEDKSNISHNVFINNSAKNGGSAITGASSNIADNAFINNYAKNGGAIQIIKSTNVTHNVFINNSAQNGGAIYVQFYLFDMNNQCILNAENNLFENNSAQNGGAICAERAHLKINNCTFTNNTADTGASVSCVDDPKWTQFGWYSSLEILDSTFINNKANATGGLFHTSNNFFGTSKTVDMTIKNSEFEKNTPHLYDGAVKLYHTNLIFDLKNNVGGDSIFDVDVTVGNYYAGVFYETDHSESPTDDKGHLEVDLYKLREGNYVKITFEEQNGQSSGQAFIPLIVNDPVLDVPDVTKYYGGPEKLEITLTEKDLDAPIAGVNVTIKIDNTQYTKTTDSEGKAYVDLDLNAGDHTAKVIYQKADVTASITVNKCPTNITANNTELFVGDEANVTYELTPKNATGRVTFISNDTGVACVDNETGCINAIGQGTATITISFKGNENYMDSDANITVTVSKTPTNITLENVTMALKVNDNVSSGATLTPADAGNLTYTSSNSTVAIVEGGKIKALARGDATITVSFAGDNKYAAAENKTITVTVSLNDASVSVNNNTLNLFVDDNFTLVATTVPTGLNVTYIPDDSGVVNISENGVVTALKEGTGTITVKICGNGVYVENTTTVTVTVSKIPTEITAEGCELYVNDNATISYVLIPKDAEGEVRFMSNDTSVVNASAETGIVVGYSEGTATISITYLGNDKYESSSTNVSVTVSKKPTELNITVNYPQTYDPVRNFLVSGQVMYRGTQEGTKKGSVDIYLNDEFKLTINVNNESSFRCDLGPLDADTYELRARYHDDTGEFNESEWFGNYTINQANTTIDIPESSIELVIGEIANIGAVLSPSEAGNLTYSSNDTNIATVNEKGDVTAVSAGTVTITVSFEGNKNYVATVNQTVITVSKIPTEINITQSSVELYVGGQGEITWAKLIPTEAGSLSYASNDTNVIWVSTSGEFTTESAGTAIITVSFAGDDTYAAAENKTISVTVSLKDASVSVENATVDLNVGDTFAIVATTIPVGLNVTFVPDDSGVVSVDDFGVVTALKEGTAIITVKVGGDGVYVENSTTVTVTVSKVSTVINAVYNSGSGELVATLTNNVTGQPIKGAYVVIKLAGETYKVRTNSTGQATLSTADIAPGSYVATVSYKGSVRYLPYNTSVDVAFMGYANISAVYDADANEITVTLVDSISGKALKGAYVTVKLGNTKYKVKIDATGQGKLSLYNATPGNYTASVAYNGGSKYYVVNTTVDVAFMGYANITAVYDDSTKELTVTLVNNVSGKAIKGAYVYVKVDGKTSKVKIDATGQSKLSLANLAPGSYEAIITYKGSANKYYPANTTTEIIVKNNDGS